MFPATIPHKVELCQMVMIVAPTMQLTTHLRHCMVTAGCKAIFQGALKIIVTEHPGVVRAGKR
jgi:hypothetical protein